MTQNVYTEHVPKRRPLGFKPRRCRCGNELPCPVRATIERQQYFVRDAAPDWGPGRTVGRARAPQAAGRPLMTPGQQRRSSQGGRW
jgi:hypothetical protein